jgi:hypothetical protein
VLAHAPSPYFALLLGNQRKNVEPTHRLTLRSIKLNKISTSSDIRFPAPTHQGNSRVRLLLLIKVAQDLFVTLADGKSDT